MRFLDYEYNTKCFGWEQPPAMHFEDYKYNTKYFEWEHIPAMNFLDYKHSIKCFECTFTAAAISQIINTTANVLSANTRLPRIS